MPEEPSELQILYKIVEVIDRRYNGHPVGTYAESIINVYTEEIQLGDNYQVGQAGAVGPNAHAHDISFQQAWTQSANDLDLPTLAVELLRLRQQMEATANGEPERYQALAQIASAEKAANANNGPAVLRQLASAGKWALDTATSLGVQVASSAIKTAMGLG